MLPNWITSDTVPFTFTSHGHFPSSQLKAVERPPGSLTAPAKAYSKWIG